MKWSSSWVQDRLIDYCWGLFISKNEETPYNARIFRAFLDFDISEQDLYILSMKLKSKPIDLADCLLKQEHEWEKEDVFVFVENSYERYEPFNYAEVINKKLQSFAILKTSDEIYEWELWHYYYMP